MHNIISRVHFSGHEPFQLSLGVTQEQIYNAYWEMVLFPFEVKLNIFKCDVSYLCFEINILKKNILHNFHDRSIIMCKS